MTLLVRGRPGAGSGTTERTGVARLTAQCSAEPLPAGTTFVLSWTYETGSPAPADVAYQFLPR